METRTQATHLAFGLATALLALALFHFFGLAPSEVVGNRSLFQWIGGQWASAGGDYSHAWLMPLISAGIVWWKRRELAAAVGRVSGAGLALLIVSLALHVIAYRAQQPRLSLVALVGVIWAVPFFVYGWPVAKRLSFPVAYLLLCFCSYALVYLTFNLRLLTSVCAASLLNGLAISATRVGTAIYSQAGGGFNFDVADACSGLRSLVVMTALAAPYAYFTQDTPLRKWLLFALSIPMAVAANVVRIVTIALVAEGLGTDVAMRVYHDFSGYIVFVASVLLLTGTGQLLHVASRRWGEACTARAATPS